MSKIKRLKFNVSILGETQVGKTNMVSVLTGQGFKPEILSTIGIDNFVDKAVFDNTEYTLKFLILLDKKDTKKLSLTQLLK